PEDLSLVLGRGSIAELEILPEIASRDGIPLYRRMGGGCSVVLDPGNLILSLAIPLPGVLGVRDIFDAITKWVIEGLDELGIPEVEKSGSSDLSLKGKKVGGSCVYRPRDFFYYSTTLLFAPPIEASERYLTHPPREPEYRDGRSHTDFLGSLPGNAAEMLPRLQEVFHAPALMDYLATRQISG
ncbi:MAG: hypothetical protein QF492_05600, partial [Candidatus Krumholzibacteria bacterium]|nr:hypothetical protein [Candidatus Krumholzibacteria bacterium]